MGERQWKKRRALVNPDAWRLAKGLVGSGRAPWYIRLASFFFPHIKIRFDATYKANLDYAIKCAAKSLAHNPILAPSAQPELARRYRASQREKHIAAAEKRKEAAREEAAVLRKYRAFLSYASSQLSGADPLPPKDQLTI